MYKKEKKLLILTENYYKGGVDTFIENIITSLSPEKYFIAVNNDHVSKNSYEYKYNNLNSIVYGYKPFKSLFSYFKRALHIESKTLLRLNYFLCTLYEYTLGVIEYIFLSISIYKKAISFLENDFTILIVSGGYPASLFCRVFPVISKLINLNNRIIYSIHSCAQRSIFLFFLIDKILDNLLLLSTDKIVFVSISSKEYFNKNRGINNELKLLKIYNWIDDPILSNKSIFLPINSKCKQPFRIVSLGTYTLYKGHITVLKALRLLVSKGKNIVFELHGYGNKEEYNQLKTKIKELDLENSVSLNSFGDTTNILKKADILILASLKYEAFGLSILDAMSMGIPVIGSNIGGIPEVLSYSPDLIFKAGDYKDLAAKIEFFYNNEQTCWDEGLKARKAYLNSFTGTYAKMKYNQILFGEI
tara:strand:- start:23538 stop:24788 length:1251 start_codon:yes stop_codon:yes gene_type:complete